MIQILNRYIPFGKFKAMAVWPFIFIRRDKEFRDIDLRHEVIHGEQQKELLLVGFYVLYGLFFLWESLRCLCDKHRGQAPVGIKPRNYIHRVEHTIIFEREAYAMQNNEAYMKHRPWYAWTEFIGAEPL